MISALVPLYALSPDPAWLSTNSDKAAERSEQLINRHAFRKTKTYASNNNNYERVLPSTMPTPHSVLSPSNQSTDPGVLYAQF